MPYSGNFCLDNSFAGAECAKRIQEMTIVVMSELQKTKKELIQILDQIPASGSFEGADLAMKASVLIERLNQLKVEKSLFQTQASAPAPDAKVKSS
jgi:hypothetical protein